MTAAKTERNAAIVAGYLAGNSRAQLAEVFGTSGANIHRIVTAAGVSLTADERNARRAAGNRRLTLNPDYRRNHSARMKRWWAERRGEK